MNSTFGGTERVRTRAAPPPVLLHPTDASARGIGAGDRVRVGNDRGSFEAIAAVSDAARPGVVVSEKGHWGSPLNETVAERDADMGGGAVFHDNAVEIEPIR